MNRMTFRDYVCMSICYALTGFLFWAITHQREFAGFVMGCLP